MPLAKRIGGVILAAAAANYVLLVLSIGIFHSDHSLYRSFNLGDKLTLTASQKLATYSACWPTSPDKTSSVCQFSDFWQRYTIVFDKGIVTSKYRAPVPDMLHPRMFISPQYLKWVGSGVALLLIVAAGLSVWFVLRG